MIQNFRAQLFEPRLPLKREGGLLARCDFFWENAPAIKLGTRTGWWGDLVNTRSIGSEYGDIPDEPVQGDGEFLARREALARAALQPLQENIQEITEIETSATNPYADRVDMDAIFSVEGRADQIVVHVPGEAEADDVEVLPEGVWWNTSGGDIVLQDTSGGTPNIQGIARD